jgi:hypothetical protein
MPIHALTDSRCADFHRDGYLVIPGLFDCEEAAILQRTAKTDAALRQHAHDLKDGEGGTAKLVPDSALKEIGEKLFEAGTEFWDPAIDQTVGAGKR